MIRTIGRILCVCLAFILAFMPLMGGLAWLFNDLIHGSVIYDQAGNAIRPEQLSILQTEIRNLSGQYGFDETWVTEAFGSAQLDAYGTEVRTFMQDMFRRQEEEEEEMEPIFPYYMWADGLDRMLEDEGYLKTVERTQQRLTAKDIVAGMEKLAQKLIIPIRPPIILMGYERVRGSETVMKAVDLLRYWYLVPCVVLPILLLILIFDHREFLGFTGAGLTGGALILAVSLAFVRMLGISGAAQAMNPMFARYLSEIFTAVAVNALWIILPCLAVGIFLLVLQRRRT